MNLLLSQMMRAVAVILGQLLSIYFWVVLIAALLTWVNPDPRNPIVRFLYNVTEPVLSQIRRRLPFVCAAGIDFSPLVLMLAIQFLQMVVVQTLFELAARMSMAMAAGSILG